MNRVSHEGHEGTKGTRRNEDERQISHRPTQRVHRSRAQIGVALHPLWLNSAFPFVRPFVPSYLRGSPRILVLASDDTDYRSSSWPTNPPTIATSPSRKTGSAAVGNRGCCCPRSRWGAGTTLVASGPTRASILTKSRFHENCKRMLFAAFDQGITHFDLANNYGPPPGKRRGTRRAHPRIRLRAPSRRADHRRPRPATGCGMARTATTVPKIPAEQPRRVAETPAARLRRHLLSPSPGHEHALGRIARRARPGSEERQGDLRRHQQLSRRLHGRGRRRCKENGFPKPVIHQPNYNMFDRWIENDLLPVTERHGYRHDRLQPHGSGPAQRQVFKRHPRTISPPRTGGFLRPSHITDVKLAR